jgi:gamma-butyrobetaine dioxygenase
MEIDARSDFLRIRPDGAAGESLDFHWFWLRHNCDCCRHPQTNERILCSSSVPLDLRPLRVAATADGDAIEIDWDEADRHRSRYALSWLDQHAYARGRDTVAPPPGDATTLERRLDTASDVSRLRDLCLEPLAAHGAVVVRGAGDDTDRLIDALAGDDLEVFGSHFGRIEDLRTDNTTNQNNDQLGYTDAPVDLHTDQPFLPHPPRYQMLHCMRPAADGGDNRLADVRLAAAYLRATDAEAYELLTSVPVRFHRVQRAFEAVHVAPILELQDDELFRVRSSYFTMDPHRLPFARMEAYYRAYNRFTALVRDPRHHFHVRLGAGDFVLYDNFRMLHARTGFSGARWMRGVYFDDPATRAAREESASSDRR